MPNLRLTAAENDGKLDDCVVSLPACTIDDKQKQLETF